MKKSLLALMTMAVLGSGFAVAEVNDTEVSNTGRAVFQWRGSVAEWNDQSENTLTIVPAQNSKDLDEGTLYFEPTGPDSAVYNGSDQLRFRVVTTPETVDENTDYSELESLKFTYELTRLETGINDIPTTENDTAEKFKVEADGEDLALNESKLSNGNDNVVALEIAIDDEDNSLFKPLDSVFAYATILVTQTDSI